MSPFNTRDTVDELGNIAKVDTKGSTETFW